MANPLSNEKELFEKIERKKSNIPPELWELLEHHLGNELYAITLIAGSYVSGKDKEPIPPEDGEKIIRHCEEIKNFLRKIRQVSRDRK